MEETHDLSEHIVAHRALDEKVTRNTKVLFEKSNGNPSLSVQIPLMHKDISRMLKWMEKVNKTTSGLIISLFLIVFGQFAGSAFILSLFLIRMINENYPGQFP